MSDDHSSKNAFRKEKTDDKSSKTKALHINDKIYRSKVLCCLLSVMC